MPSTTNRSSSESSTPAGEKLLKNAERKIRHLRQDNSPSEFDELVEMQAYLDYQNALDRAKERISLRSIIRKLTCF